MRSSLVQRQIRNNISYQESPPRNISGSQKLPIPYNGNRPQSANMANRSIKYQSFINDSQEVDRRRQRTSLMQGNSWMSKPSICRPSQKLNNASYIEEDSQRLYARALVWDKEKLFQEQQQLKTTLNDLRDENTKLRTRVMQLEQAIQKYDKLLEDYETTGPVKSQLVRYTQEQHLTNTLKKEISGLKKSQSLKEEEIQKLKRNLKQTRIQELEIEKKAYVDETIRLKYLLEQTLQASFLYMSENNVQQDVQDKIMEQSQNIQELKLEKLELDAIILRLQKQCLHYKTSQIEVENKLSKDIKKLRTQLIEKHKENETLRPSSKRGRNDTQIQQLVKERELFLQSLKNKDKIIEELERKIRGSPINDSVRDTDPPIFNKNERSDTLTFQNVEHLALTESQKYQLRTDSGDEFSKQKKVLKDSLIAEQSVKDAYLQTSLKTGGIKMSISQQNPQGKIAQFSVTQPQPSLGRRQPPVQFHEVKWIGETLRYRLRALKINWNEIDDYIFSEASKEEGFTTLGDLKSYLMKFPFDLTMVQASLVGRYAIESESETHTNDQSKQSNPIVKSVLRRVVGIYSTDETIDSALRLKLQEFLPKYKHGIIETIKTHVSLKATSISKTQLEEVFILMGLELSTAEIEYLIVQCILESPSSLQLNFTEMMKFIPDPLDPRALHSSNSLMSPPPRKKSPKRTFKGEESFNLNVQPAQKQQEERIDFYPTFQNQQGSESVLQNLPEQQQDEYENQYQIEIDQQIDDKNEIMNEVFDSDENQEELENEQELNFEEEVKAKSESNLQDNDYVVPKSYINQKGNSSAGTHRSPVFTDQQQEQLHYRKLQLDASKSITNSQKSVRENIVKIESSSNNSHQRSQKKYTTFSERQNSDYSSIKNKESSSKILLNQESKDLDIEEEEKIASHNSDTNEIPGKDSQNIFKVDTNEIPKEIGKDSSNIFKVEEIVSITENQESQNIFKAYNDEEDEMIISDRNSEEPKVNQIPNSENQNLPKYQSHQNSVRKETEQQEKDTYEENFEQESVRKNEGTNRDAREDYKIIEEFYHQEEKLSSNRFDQVQKEANIDTQQQSGEGLIQEHQHDVVISEECKSIEEEEQNVPRQQNEQYSENRLNVSSSEQEGIQEMQFSKLGIVQSAQQDELWEN